MFYSKLMLTAAITATAAIAITAKGADKDPVMMTVDGKPVHKSEFMYLYNKNNAQQSTPQTLDQYLEMFVNYKLKVAEAEKAKIDTTAQFRNEFEQFKTELAVPYMRDTTILPAIYAEAYDHIKEDVKVSHIMFILPKNPEEQAKQMALADSVRTALVNGGDWNEAVKKYSIDRGSRERNGSMGWLRLGSTPWAFEKVAYDTPVGTISGVVNSGFGYHIVRPDERRANRGEVLVQHILKLTARKSPEEAAHTKVQIDSLYNLVVNGADFAALAKDNSEDPGSRGQGGQLDWFGTGMMVNEFDSVAFALKNGEISKPFATAYGYHIIKKIDSRPTPDFEKAMPKIEAAIMNDERGNRPEQVYIDNLIKTFKGSLVEDGLDKVRNMIAANAGGYDSVAIEALKVSDIPVYTVSGRKYPVSEVMKYVAVTSITDPENARGLIASAAQQALRNRVYEEGREQLYKDNADYRNLVNEYRDGILLFEISNREVWDKAAKDTDGLNAYFAANKDKYEWEAPKYKGFIVFAATDSVMNLAKTYTDSLGEKFDPQTFIADLRAKFGKDVRAERVLAAKGDNAISDYLVFDGVRPDESKMRWKHYFAFGGHIAEQPEEVADVRGLVTTDYQNLLEQQWLDRLHKTHKVKIDKKVVDSMR